MKVEVTSVSRGHEVCLASGIDGYLTKPIIQQGLDELLSKVLASRQTSLAPYSTQILITSLDTPPPSVVDAPPPTPQNDKTGEIRQNPP
jgi:hypothetical protein